MRIATFNTTNGRAYMGIFIEWLPPELEAALPVRAADRYQTSAGEVTAIMPTGVNGPWPAPKFRPDTTDLFQDGVSMSELPVLTLADGTKILTGLHYLDHIDGHVELRGFVVPEPSTLALASGAILCLSVAAATRWRRVAAFGCRERWFRPAH
ncbi:MAG: hypothetical protein DWQ37_20230 [Planctomycetota bacterium]|nr:MAG: hypothetical protein DWQ37_20230 [Planctomycetota bacterium]